MERSAVVLILFCAVSLAQVPDNLEGINDKNDDRWTWGLVGDNKTDNRYQEPLSNKTNPFVKIEDPCPYYDPPKPSFKAPGRKISDEKCEEYKWDKTVTEERWKRISDCYEEVNKGKPKPPAAVGGRAAYQGEFPHMGAIGWKAVVGGYIFKCGSSLISNKFVLTAAHCSRVSSGDSALADVLPKIVRLNDRNLYFKNEDNIYYHAEDVNISRIIVHPEFKPPKKYYDIALMELEKEVQFNWLMQPACLWTNAEVSDLGHEATLTGWGVLQPGSYDISPELQAAVVHNINNTYCDQLLNTSHNRNWRGLKEHQLCAGILAGGVDACQGDSGGPLQVKQHIAGSRNESVYHIIGVTSFGIGCALANHPGIYTRVSSFTDWIEGYVWPQG